jgi:hypothetical protein
MQNGKNLTIEEATSSIKAFERQETGRQIPLADLAIGQKLDLDLIKSFIAAIENHEQKAISMRFESIWRKVLVQV